jgi:hypothetical protein
MNAEKAAVDSTAMESTETFQMSQNDFKPMSVSIPMEEVSTEVAMEGGYFKDEGDDANNNNQSTVLEQGTSSFPLQQSDTVVTLELGKQSQPSEGIPLTQESLSAMEVSGSQGKGEAMSMNAALIASRDSMFLTNDQPKQKKRKQRPSSAAEPIELEHPYQTRKKGKSDGDVWMKYYDQLKVYYLKNNNCDIPVDVEVKVGTSDNEETLQLGIWLQQEKGKMYYYSAANPERHRLLTVWLAGNPLSTSFTSLSAISPPAAVVSSEAIGKQEFSPSKGRRGRRAKPVQNEEETNIPKSPPPPPPNSLSASPLPIPSPTTRASHEKHNSLASSKSRGLTKSFEVAQKEKQQSADNSVNESSSALLTPKESSEAPIAPPPLSSKNMTRSPVKGSADKDSTKNYQQLLKKQELLSKAKKQFEEAPDGQSASSILPSSNTSLVAFEYKKNNLFYIGLGKVKKVDLVDLSGNNKKLTVVQKFLLSNPSNIEEAVLRETEELIQVTEKDITTYSNGKQVVFYHDLGMRNTFYFVSFLFNFSLSLSLSLSLCVFFLSVCSFLETKKLSAPSQKNLCGLLERKKLNFESV